MYLAGATKGKGQHVAVYPLDLMAVLRTVMGGVLCFVRFDSLSTR